MQIKTANGKRVIVITRGDWTRIGQQNGWVKEADAKDFGKTALDTANMMATSLGMAQHKLEEIFNRAMSLGRQMKAEGKDEALQFPAVQARDAAHAAKAEVDKIANALGQLVAALKGQPVAAKPA